MKDDLLLDMLDVRYKSGDEWMCCCPFHDDSSPSMAVNVRKEVYICYGCGAKGKLSQMAQSMGVSWHPRSPTDTLVSDIELLLAPPPEPHDEKELARFNMPTDYWSEVRGFRPATIRAWELGYDPSMRAGTIPVRSIDGQYLGVVLRHVDSNVRPKYLYQRGFKKSHHLFGAHKAKHHPAWAIVEGPLDAIALWDVGVPAVALFGAQVSETQRDLIYQLGPKNVVIATDSDAEGRKAAVAVREALGARIPHVMYAFPPGVKDVGDLESSRRASLVHLLQAESSSSLAPF